MLYLILLNISFFVADCAGKYQYHDYFNFSKNEMFVASTISNIVSNRHAFKISV